MQQHIEGVVESIMGFVGILTLFPAVKIFLKNWQSYRRKFGVLLFWDQVYRSLDIK